MDESSEGREPGELGYGLWIGFWGQLAVLALLVVLGASFASAGRAPGDDVCGLTLSLAALALAFLSVKRRFDGVPADCASVLLVDDMPNLIAVIVIFAVLGLAGLIVAADFGRGGLHDGGVALFVVSALAVFLSMKSVFDTRDRQH
ncbi:MAG TPA: hypothetical protein VND95_05730 [Stellaceae bacterium]|nr:hypothetical protein [Stellaceae bacterium]